jgi:transketolase
MNVEKKHESQRGYFAYELYEQMAKRTDLVLITGDLGFKQFDAIQKDFPDRYFNVGASEQAMVGIAVGMALRGKRPVCYSITNFMLYRPFEFIRNYVDHEKIPVIMVGAGRDKDYTHDGYTHHSEDAKQVLSCFPNVRQYWPEKKEDIAGVLQDVLESKEPSFISLTRS